LNQDKLLKIIAVIICVNMVMIPVLSIIPIQQQKQVVQAAEVTPVLDTMALTAIITAIAFTYTSFGYFHDLTISPTEMQSIKDKVNAGGSSLVTQVNNLGTAIKTGAGQTAVQALASGACIYAVLQAMQDVLFPTRNLPMIYNSKQLFGISGNKALYISYSTSQYNGVPSFKKIVTNGDYVHYNISNYLGSAGSETGRLSLEFYDILNSKTLYSYSATIGKNVFVNGFTVPNDFSIHYTYYLDDFINGVDSFTMPAATLANQATVSFPATLPADIVTIINNYAGTSDLVIGVPDDYVSVPDNNITVDPTTVIDDPAVTDPTDTNDGTLLGTVGAILTGVTGISGILTGIDSAIDSAVGAITQPLTAISDYVIALDAAEDAYIDEWADYDPLADLQNQMELKLPIIASLTAGFAELLSGPFRPLIIAYPFFGETRYITLEWYEPMRLQIRYVLGLIFKLMMGISIYAIISSVFGISIIHKASTIIMDRGDSNAEMSFKNDVDKYL
jgi:hypothetical protein